MTPRLLAISDRRALGGRPWEEWLRDLEDLAVDSLQIREKDLEDRAVLDLAERAAGRSFALSINGRADIASAADAHGIHLPARALPAEALKERFGDRFVLGRSTHSLEEVEAARREGVDYVTFGPVFSTPGKGPPQGLEELRAAVDLGVPVLALGGVTAEHLEDLLAAGVHGVAGIRVFHDPDELASLATAWRRLHH